MKKRLCAIISSILAIVMVIQILPMNVIANAVNEAQLEVSTTTEEQIYEESVLEELTEYRTENQKRFLMSNKTVKAIIYSEPVHYENDGKFYDIDTTPKYEEATENSDVNGYVSSNGNMEVKFAKKTNSGKLVTIKQGKYKLSWEYLDYSGLFTSKNIEIKEKEKQNSIIEDSVINSSRTVTYADVSKDTDLQYVFNGNGLKENIIVKDKLDEYMYSFELKANNLELELKDNAIIASDKKTKEVVFEIPAPYMYDAKGSISHSVEYSLEQKGNKYTFTVRADSEWINAEERAFPVVIDPQVDTNQKRADIYATYITSGSSYAGTNHHTETWMNVGRESTGSGKMRGLIKFKLPDLNKSDMVVGAHLSLAQGYVDAYAPSSTPDAAIKVYPIKDSWDERTVTWNNQPDLADNSAIDYALAKASETSAVVKHWDITKVVKGWYEGVYGDSSEPFANNGLMLISGSENKASMVDSCIYAYYYTENGSQAGAYPVISIVYLNNKGLESYWSYSSYSIDTAGSAYINDYTGNLVYEMPILSSISEIMPLTLVGYYNNYCAGDTLVAGKSSSSRTSIGKGFRLNVQQTVLPSSQYGLTGEAKDTYPYVYTDADGTEHYFKEETKDGTTTYKDEDGLDLELKLPTNISGVKYTITNEQDDVLYFNSKGNLCKQEDANGNTILISFKDAVTAVGKELDANSRISQIKDGAGHTFTFTYYENSETVEQNFVKKITDNAGREITFTTTSSADGLAGLVTKVTYSDGTHLNIQYVDSNEGLINHVQANDGYALNFDYTSVPTGRRVRTVKEYGRNSSGVNVAGQIVTFDRTKYNTTVIRSAGMDGIHVTQIGDDEINESNADKDDIITTLQFDDAGRTTSQQVAYGSGAEVGAGSYSYTSTTDDATTLGSKNKVSTSANLGKNVINLLYGGNAETTSGWTTGSSASVTTTKGVDSDNKYMGLKSLKINNSAFTGSGVSYYRQDITGVTVGSNYTMSAYVKTSDLTEKYDTNLKGAYLQMTAYNSAGTKLSEVYSEKLTETTDTAINKGWRRLTATIELPANTAKLRVYLCFENMTGTAYYDCIQVESGSTANSYNMLENSSFEKTAPGLPEKWDAIDVQYTTNSSGAVLDGLTTVTKRAGTYSLRVEGEEGVAKGYGQEIAVEGNPNDTYIISGWARGYAVNPTHHNETKFEIAIKVYYQCKDNKTGATEEVTQYKDAAKFNPTINDWQYATSPFVLKYKGGESGKTYTPTKIKVVPRYISQSNQAYFDHVQLIKDVASSYVYDDEGNVVSVAANAEQKNDMTYEGKNLKTYKDAAGYETKYNYDTKHNLTSIETAKGVKTANTYASNGNLTSTELKNSNGSSIIKTEKEYYGANSENGIKAGAYLRKDFDENGYETYYQSEWATGLPVAVTDANGVKTSYSYTALDQLQTVTTGISRVKYVYKTLSNVLSSLIFSGTASGSPSETYSFTYDSYGNRKTTSVGGKVLSTNNYAANNGALQSTTYGNGDTVSYSYNNLGQVNYEYKNRNEYSYHWIYNADGTPLIHRDNENALKYEYSYDAIDRLIRQEITTNQYNNATHIGFTEFGYDKRNNLTKLINEIDGRRTAQTYSYSKVTESAQSENYTKDNLPTMYKAFSTRYATYDYDSLNRINLRTFSTTKPLYNNYLYTTSGRNTSGSSTYRTAQLRTEIIADTAYRYTYDKVGNITKIEKGNRPNAGTSEPGTPNYSNYYNYQYDNLNQLTKITDSSGVQTDITYDEIGNILSQHSHLDNSTVKDIQYTYTADTDSDGNGAAEAGWNNLLTLIQITDANGTRTETIDYDAIGNPISYRGASLDFNGRELESYNKGSNTISYTYDSEGVRGTKTVNGVKSTYQYINGMLVYEKRGSAQLYFYYDSYGYLSAITYYPDCTTDKNYIYYVLTNTQGDVLGIYNGDGDLRVSYEYDTWGNATIAYDNSGINIGTINPIRYRGYYYDAETGFYYVSSRYYDPEIGRFVSPDTTEVLTATPMGLTDKNLFAYCDNNPAARIDVNGEYWESALDIVGIVLSVAEICMNPDDPWAWVGLVADIACLALPVVAGGGIAARSISKIDDAADILKTVKKVDKASDVSKTAKRGWSVGDDITTLTKTGNNPSWSTVRQRYWKNEAYFSPNAYAKSNLDRMMKGKAPLVDLNGKSYSMELHHKIARRNGGSNSYNNLIKVTPWEHAAIDPFRRFVP